MSAAGSLTSLITPVAGGIGAALLDRKFGQYAKKIGPITVTPGMAAAVGLAIASRFRIPAKGLVTSLAAGGLVYEGTELGKSQLLPMLGVSGEDYVGYDMARFPGYGIPQMGPSGQDASLSQAYADFRNAA